MSVVAKNAKNDEIKGVVREGRDENLGMAGMAGVGDCCGHCRDVLGFEARLFLQSTEC